MMYPEKAIMVNPEKPQLGKVIAIRGDYAFVEVDKKPKGTKIQTRHILTGKVFDSSEGFEPLVKQNLHYPWVKDCVLSLGSWQSAGINQRRWEPYSSGVPEQMRELIDRYLTAYTKAFQDSLLKAVSELEKQEDARIAKLKLSEVQERVLIGLMDGSLKSKRLFQGLKDLGREDLAGSIEWKTPFMKDEYLTKNGEQITVENFLKMIAG